MTGVQSGAYGVIRDEAGERPRQVIAPRVTRAAAYVVMVGILTQAFIAGGFLAGHPLNDVHMLVGIPLLVAALTLVGVGLFGRRKRSEPRSVLLPRIGVLLALLTTAVVGIAAGQGERDLLMIHIPLAIVSMGLAARVVSAVNRDNR